MSSKRAIRRRACKGKQRHGSFGAACAAIKSLQRRTGRDEALQAYACGFCGGFHFGHYRGVRPS